MKKPIGDKPTAFKWFLQKIEEAGCLAVILNNMPHGLYEQVLEKEEEQMVAAWEDGFEQGTHDITWASGENYYVENYGFLNE